MNTHVTGHEFSGALVNEIFEIIEQFKRSWEQGQPMQIEEVLEDSQKGNPDETRRQKLLAGLLQVELNHQENLPKANLLRDYLNRFPNDADTVRSVFAETASASYERDTLLHPSLEPETLPSAGDGCTKSDDATLPHESAYTDLGTLAGSMNTLSQGPAVRVSVTSNERTDLNFGDYEILREIARGGMGVVYEARQRSLNRTVALKMILAGQFASQEDIERFRTEAESAANLDHWGIVPIFEIGEHRGNHYFSMGYIEGRSLQDEVREGPLEAKKAAALLWKISEAITYAHERGVIHRDLKPANVLIDPEGQPKITDFGLAKQVSSDSDLTRTGAVMGTPSYMPPEQAAGKHSEVGPSADIYALGAILYCLTTGRPPFQASTPLDTLMQVLDKEAVPPRELNSSIPKDLETITLHCLNKSSERRYASAKHLQEELDRFLNGDPVLARPVSRMERGWRWAKKHRTLATLITVMIFMAIAGPWIAIKQAQLARSNQRLTQQEKEQRLIAEAGQKKAERLSEQNRRTLVRARLMQADSLVEQSNNIPAAIPYYVDALRLDTKDPQRAARHRVRIQSAINKTHRFTQFWRHQDGVNHIAFDTRESMVATSSHDRTVQVRNLTTGELVCKVLEHQYPVWASAFLEDDSILVTTSGTGLASELRFWDVNTGEEVGEAIASDVNHYMVERTSGGNFVAAELSFYNGLGELEVWDPKTRSKLRSFKMKSSFDPDEIDAAMETGWFIQTGTSERTSQTVTLYHMDTGEKLGPFEHSEKVYGAAMNQDGSRLATYTSSQIFVWDVKEAELLVEVPAEKLRETGAYLPQTANGFGFSFDSNNVVLGSVNRVTLSVDQRGQLERVQEVPTLGTYHVQASPSGRWFVYNDGGATLRLWDVKRERFVEAPMQHSANIQILRFTSDERELVSCSLDGTVRVWDLATKQSQVTRQFNHNWIVGFMQLNSSGDELTSWAGSRIRFSDLNSGETKDELNLGAGIMWISLPQDSELLAYGTNDNRAVVFDRREREKKRTITYDQKFVREVHLSPDGRFLLALTVEDVSGPTGSMGTGFVHDVDTGELIAGPLDFHEGKRESSFLSMLQNLGGMLKLSGVTSMAVSPDSECVAYGGGIANLKNGSVQPIVRLLNVASGEETNLDLSAAKGWFLIEKIQFSSSGRFLLIQADNPMGGSSSVFAVYDRNANQFVFAPTPFPTRITEVAISPEEKAFALIAGSTVSRYSLENGQPLGRPLQHPENVSRICFRGEDGLVTSANDNVVRVWDLQSGTYLTPPLECRFAVNDVLVTPDADVLVASYASVNVWPLQDSADSVADLDRLGRLASSQVLQDGDTTYVDASQLSEDWNAMSNHDLFAPTDSQIESWYADRMSDARALGDWSTETFVREHYIKDRHPNDPYALELQGDAYAVNRQFERAALCYHQALKSNTENADWLMYRQACALLGARRKPELAEHCRRFIENLDMTNSFNAERIGKIMLLGGIEIDGLASAIELINYAYEQDGNNPWFLQAKSMAALKTNQMKQCVELATQVIDQGAGYNIRTPIAHCVRARARQMQGDWSGAAADLRTAQASRAQFENNIGVWMDLIHLDLLIAGVEARMRE